MWRKQLDWFNFAASTFVTSIALLFFAQGSGTDLAKLSTADLSSPEKIVSTLAPIFLQIDSAYAADLASLESADIESQSLSDFALPVVRTEAVLAEASKLPWNLEMPKQDEALELSCVDAIQADEVLFTASVEPKLTETVEPKLTETIEPTPIEQLIAVAHEPFPSLTCEAPVFVSSLFFHASSASNF